MTGEDGVPTSSSAPPRPLARLPELLDRYRTTFRSEPSVTDTISELVKRSSKKDGVVALRREIGEFREMMVASQEALALAALGVAPDRLNVTDELREMGQLLGVVSVGNGGAPQLPREEQGARLRALMVAIGRKAEMAGLDSPEIVALRDRVDRLRGALARRETQLAAHHDDGSLPGDRPRALLLGRCVAASAFVLLVIVGWRVGLAWKARRERPKLTGALAELAPYFDQSVTGFMLIHCGEILRQLQEVAPRLGERAAAADPFGAVNFRSTWVAADLERIVVLLQEIGRPVLVLETRRDYPLVDVVEGLGAVVRRSGASYVQARGGWFLAKYDTHAFCVTGDEKSMCALLDRLSRNKPGSIRDELARTLENCHDENHAVICWGGRGPTEDQKMPGWATPGNVLVNLKFGSLRSVNVEAWLGFDEQRYVANVALELQELFKGSDATQIERAESVVPAETSDSAGHGVGVVVGGGTVVRISTQCALKAFVGQILPLGGMESTPSLVSVVSSVAGRAFETQVQRVVGGAGS